jgi:hypothetical protein
VKVDHVAYKICSRCNLQKTLDNFGKLSKSKDGFRTCCKACRKLEVATPEQQKMAYKRKKKYAESDHGRDKILNYKSTDRYKELHRLRCRKYESTEKFKIYRKLYEQHRYANNENYRLISNLRCRLYSALTRNKLSKIDKFSNTIELLGCTTEELWKHLESMFSDGMTRENYGKWHVDHIIPCDNFNLFDVEQQKLCFHYTNLQPLWAKDNLIKGNKIL